MEQRNCEILLIAADIQQWSNIQIYVDMYVKLKYSWDKYTKW